jgi:hypothetical protein
MPAHGPEYLQVDGTITEFVDNPEHLLRATIDAEAEGDIVTDQKVVIYKDRIFFPCEGSE